MVEILIINKQTIFPDVVPIPIFTEYFHAVSLSDKDTNIFNTSVESFELTPDRGLKPYDVVGQILRPLENKPVNPVLKRLDGKLLVPLEGLLVLPDAAAFPGKRPMVLIGHGNHDGYVSIKVIKATPSTPQGEFEITVLEKQIPSFVGYHIWFDSALKPQQGFQQTLAAKGIASYSINMNIVNALDNNEQELFNKFALDFNQRILLFFLHLKLLRIIAGETVTGDELPIRFFEGSGFKNLQDALQSTTHTGLIQLRDALKDKVDFTKLGFMGHSRGADAVSRIPAYFFKGATLADPSFPVHTEVNSRIKKLSDQIGKPVQDSIKCILALEPTAIKKNEGDPDSNKHGYIIESQQTMYFVAVGTHDEDVSLDPVRIYEFPECPKVMIAINGATHKRFNTFWAGPAEEEGKRKEKFDELKVKALSIAQHKSLLNSVCGSCFTGTLGGNPSALLPFTKKTDFVIDLPGRIDFQSAWKFGFPFIANTPVNLDNKLTSTSQENIKGKYNFEQELTAFFVEKINEGTATIRIPINPNSGDKLSNFNHFSFRFGKGFDVSDATRVEEKNFNIQFFENDTPVGKPIAGPNIKTLELKAFQAFDRTEDTNDLVIEYSILMQTAEITLAEHLSATELPRITRIDINIIPDAKKSPPNSTAKVVFGTIGGVVLGGAVGVGGALLFAAAYNAINDPDLAEGKRKKILIGSGIAGAAAFGVGAFIKLKADKHAFVFKDFLLTNRQIPAVATP